MPDWKNIKSIMFVCLGNICRSPMAECLLKHLLAERKITGITVASSATIDEEEGNPIYPPARAELLAHGITPPQRHAVRLKPEDGDKYDIFLGMEDRNVRAMREILGPQAAEKCYRLLDFTDNPRNIADPWFSGNFAATWRDLDCGCKRLVELLTSERE